MFRGDSPFFLFSLLAASHTTPRPPFFLPAQVCMALEEEFVITIPDAESEKILSAEDAINFM